jgi:hypothetical protein
MKLVIPERVNHRWMHLLDNGQLTAAESVRARGLRTHQRA